MALTTTHLNRIMIECSYSVPQIKECHENALFKSFKMSLLRTVLAKFTQNPLFSEFEDISRSNGKC